MVVGRPDAWRNDACTCALGLIENMAYITCPHCDERISLTVPQSLPRPQRHLTSSPLGQLPMDATFAQIADKGTFSTELPQGLVPDATQSLLDL